MDGWLILAAGCAIVALVFFLLWRSALRAQTEAERLTAQAGRAAKEAQVTSARQSAFLAALQLAQTDAAILLSPQRIVLEWNPPEEAEADVVWRGLPGGHAARQKVEAR